MLTRTTSGMNVPGMKMPLFAWLALPLGLLAVNGRADQNPEIVPLGHDTYALTRWAETGFTRSTEKLKTQALEDAAAYCAKLHKELKVISTTTAQAVRAAHGVRQRQGRVQGAGRERSGASCPGGGVSTGRRDAGVRTRRHGAGGRLNAAPRTRPMRSTAT